LRAAPPQASERPPSAERFQIRLDRLKAFAAVARHNDDDSTELTWELSDVADAFRAVVDVAHGGDHVHDLATALFCAARGAARQFVGVACVRGVLLHRARELLHAGRGLF